MPKVEETGHLKEQATKISFIRPELAIFHGYTYQRTSNTVIEVWIPGKCSFCKTAIRRVSSFVRTGSATDEEIQRHGLKLCTETAPIRGLRLHTSSPLYCEPCKDKWLNGDALPQVGETQEYEYTWN